MPAEFLFCLVFNTLRRELALVIIESRVIPAGANGSIDNGEGINQAGYHHRPAPYRQGIISEFFLTITDRTFRPKKWHQLDSYCGTKHDFTLVGVLSFLKTKLWANFDALGACLRCDQHN